MPLSVLPRPLVSLSLPTADDTCARRLFSLPVHSAVDALALKNDIRVNTLCPSWVDTPMIHNAMKTNPILGPLIEAVTPLKRAAAPDEVADYIVFLCSPSASYINGTALAIDGGLTLPAPPPLPM